jgi:hypothetical protein
MGKQLRRCKRCGNTFELGLNGTIHDCDKCLYIKRDSNGFFWYPTEEEIVLRPVNGTEKDDYVVTRQEAFN